MTATQLPLPPGSTIGILGGGQLGRMLAQAAAQLGFKSHIYCARTGRNPAFDVAAQHSIADFDNQTALKEFAKVVDVVTFEFENVPAATLDTLLPRVAVYPPRKALEVAQDRLTEKQFISKLDIPVSGFAAVNSANDLEQALHHVGKKALLKTRRLGYDGKGQAMIDAEKSGLEAFNLLGAGEMPLILEKYISFKREISVLVCRTRSGATATYDICENRHENGILRETQIPSQLPENHSALAKEMAKKIAGALDYVGILAVEMFHTPDNRQTPLIVNEIAPRVHNSGHWTADACQFSQFENHIRAIANWPLGATMRHSNCVMRNIIGEEIYGWPALAADADVSLHHYGKVQISPGRKMGHVTTLSLK